MNVLDTTKQNYRFGIRARLFSAFLLVIIIFIGVIGYVVFELHKTQLFMNKIVQVDQPSITLMGNILHNIDRSIDLLAATNKADAATTVRFDTLWKKITADKLQLDALSDEWTYSACKPAWQKIKKQLQVLYLAQTETMKSVGERKKYLLTNKVIPAKRAVLEICSIARKAQLSSQDSMLKREFVFQENIIQMVKHITFLKHFLWIILVIVTILGILVASFISWGIIKPIEQAIEIAKNIARGEHHLKIETEVNDETGELLTSLSNMQTAIAEAEEKQGASEENLKELLASLSNRIERYSNLVQRLSSGDLTQTIVVDGDDNLARLGTYLNQMTESLAEITHRILNSVHTMRITLRDLRESVNEQTRNAKEQLISVNETAAVMEEIRATSSQTLEKTKMLGDSAEHAKEEGEKGRETLSHTITSMRSIQQKVEAIAQSTLGLSDQTQQIGETISAVSNLAERSKLLALNASIEAAKAGEAGKGFAVVASEVKDLAEQSQQATEQVQKILQNIQLATEKTVMATEEGSKEVVTGLQSIDATEMVINRLSEVIKKTALVTQQIVAAVRQEAAGVDQVSEAMSNIRETSNRFSSTSGQNLYATDRLANVMKELEEIVSIYKLDKEPEEND